MPAISPNKPRLRWYLLLVLLIILAGSSAALAVLLPASKEHFSSNIVIHQLCKHTDCAWLESKALSAPEMIRLRGITLRSVSGDPQMILNMTVVNTAPRPQAYPDLIVKFFNASGQHVGTRRVEATRYLGSHSEIVQIASHSPTPISLVLPQAPTRQATYYSVQAGQSDDFK